MNYQILYDQLIETRKRRKKEDGKYYERHHIILKSMGGSNLSDNLIYLTAREHFIAHWLLWRINRNKQTAFAFWAMCNYKNKKLQGKERKFSARGYEEAKIALSQIKRKLSSDSKKKMSEKKLGKKLGKISEHRSKKLKAYFENNKFEETRICKCGKEFTITRKSDSNYDFCSISCGSKFSNKTKRKVEVINKITGEKIIFDSVFAAAKALNIGRSTIYSYKEHLTYIFKII